MMRVVRFEGAGARWRILELRHSCTHEPFARMYVLQIKDFNMTSTLDEDFLQPENWRQRLQGAVVHGAVNFNLSEDVRVLNQQAGELDKARFKDLPIQLVSLNYIGSHGFKRHQEIPKHHLKHISEVDRFFALSHRWVSTDHPDPKNQQAQELVKRLQVEKDAWVFVDFCSLPQKPRTDDETRVFHTGLSNMWRLFTSPRCSVVIISEDGYLSNTYRDLYNDTAFCCLPCFGADPNELREVLQEPSKTHLEYYRRSWCLLESVMSTLTLNTDESSRQSLHDAFSRFFGQLSSVEPDTLVLGKVPLHFYVEEEKKQTRARQWNQKKVVRPHLEEQVEKLPFQEQDLFLFVVNVFNAITLSHCTNGKDKMLIVGQFNDFLNALRISQSLELSVLEYADVSNHFDAALQAAQYTDYYAEAFPFFGRGLESKNEVAVAKAVYSGSLPLFTDHFPDPTVFQSSQQKDLRRTRRFLEMYVQRLTDAKRENLTMVLMGTGQAGKSTFLKQIKQLVGDGYSESDRLSWVPVIHANVRSSLFRLAHHDEVKSVPESWGRASSLDQRISESEAKEMHEWLSSNDGWRSCLDIGSLHLLAQLDKIALDSYHPDLIDVLHCRLRTTGINTTDYVIDKTKFILYDIGGQRHERRKWIHAFGNVTVMIYVVALDSYDLTLVEDPAVNRMQDAINDFRDLMGLEVFKEPEKVLFLNKFDLFTQKLQYTPLTVCPAFKDMNCPTNPDEAATFIGDVFSRLNTSGRPTFTHVTSAVDADKLAPVINAVKDIAIRASLVKAGLLSQ